MIPAKDIHMFTLRRKKLEKGTEDIEYAVDYYAFNNLFLYVSWSNKLTIGFDNTK